MKTISKINHAHGKLTDFYIESAREAKVGPRIKERKSGAHCCIRHLRTLPDRHIKAPQNRGGIKPFFTIITGRQTLHLHSLKK